MRVIVRELFSFSVISEGEESVRTLFPTGDLVTEASLWIGKTDFVCTLISLSFATSSEGLVNHRNNVEFFLNISSIYTLTLNLTNMNRNCLWKYEKKNCFTTRRVDFSMSLTHVLQFFSLNFARRYQAENLLNSSQYIVVRALLFSAFCFFFLFTVKIKMK